MRKLLRQIEWGPIGAFFVGTLAIGLLVLLAIVMWKGGETGHIGTSEIDRSEDSRQLEKYDRWGRNLQSRDPERMRATLKEMQREGFDEEDIREFKRLRDNYKD